MQEIMWTCSVMREFLKVKFVIDMAFLIKQGELQFEGKTIKHFFFTKLSVGFGS